MGPVKCPSSQLTGQRGASQWRSVGVGPMGEAGRAGAASDIRAA